MERPRNLVLTGFMGTGKSTLGPQVAAALGLAFVDTDTEIVARSGLSIGDLFAQRGEPYFRLLESQLCQHLASESGRVIATGGGTFLDPATRFAFQSSLVVCLTADPQVLAERLKDRQGRPLAADWRHHLKQRQPIYEALPHHLDTSNLSVVEATQHLVRLWNCR